MHPSFVSDPTAPTVSQLPSSPYAPARSYSGVPPLPANAALQLPNGSGGPVVIGGNGSGVVLRGDERPIQPSAGGRYDLRFFDRHNEYESMTGSVPWIAPRPEEADSSRRVEAQNLPTLALPLAFQQYVAVLGSTTASRRASRGGDGGASSGAMTDAQFAAAFSYERLLALDDALPKQHRGLRPLDLHRVLVTSQEEHRVAAGSDDASQQRGATTTSTSSPPFACSICLDTTTATAGASSCVVLICMHAFHFGCIKEWLLTATTCPVCRRDLRSTDAASPPPS